MHCFFVHQIISVTKSQGNCIGCYKLVKDDWRTIPTLVQVVTKASSVAANYLKSIDPEHGETKLDNVVEIKARVKIVYG